VRFIERRCLRHAGSPPPDAKAQRTGPPRTHLIVPDSETAAGVRCIARLGVDLLPHAPLSAPRTAPRLPGSSDCPNCQHRRNMEPNSGAVRGAEAAACGSRGKSTPNLAMQRDPGRRLGIWYNQVCSRRPGPLSFGVRRRRASVPETPPFNEAHSQFLRFIHAQGFQHRAGVGLPRGCHQLPSHLLGPYPDTGRQRGS